jgi:hypothetical protein
VRRGCALTYLSALSVFFLLKTDFNHLTAVFLNNITPPAKAAIACAINAPDPGSKYNKVIPKNNYFIQNCLII